MPKLKTKSDFINDAIKKHGQKYDYSKVMYINNTTKVEIVCPQHGSFWITPASHSSTGRGCSKCKGGIQRTQEEFLKLAKQKFPEFDYSRVSYINSFKKVEIICSQHGSFFITPVRFLHDTPHACQKCAKQKNHDILSERGSIEIFIQNALKVHGNKYDYSKSTYVGSCKKISIICPTHGEFYMVANNHTSKGYDCPRCSNNGVSKKEKEIVDWIRTIYSGKIIENTREIISPKELDIYLPEKNFAIEYNGLYWHSGDRVDKKAHLNKTLECKQKGIKLFHIFSDEWINKKDIIKSMIQYRLGLVESKISARKCTLEKIDKKIGREFFKSSHISGDNNAGVYFGLKHNNELVCAISLKKPIQKKYGNVLEIARFANSLNLTVQGGFQKLFKHVLEYAKNNGYGGILTYADRRFGEGEVYLRSGFNLFSSSPVDYWYTDGHERYFRFKYRANSELTEKQISTNENVCSVYGCGSNIYLWYFV